MILAQRVENDMCPLSAVVDVAKDMQLVDGQTLDDITNSNDKVVGTSGRDNGVDDAADIGGFVNIVGTLVHEFLDDVAKLLRQRLANLRASVL